MTDLIDGLIRDGYLPANFREQAKKRRDPRSEAQQVADHEAAFELLAGFATANNKRAVTKYPKDRDEKRGRQALAREVRHHMPGFVGELLALAIDPTTKSKIPAATQSGRMQPTRRIRFESPARGPGSTWARDLLLIHAMRRAMRRPRVKLEAVLAEIGEQFGLKRSRVQAIWGAHEALLERGLDTDQLPQATE
jgi:hypothetical protein